MNEINITVPKLNPNDDELLVVDIFVSEGQKITKGQKLGIFETTKAAIDFESEFDGEVKKILIKKNKYYSVGEVALKILSDQNVLLKSNNSLNDEVELKSKEKKISLKAQKIIQENNINIEDLNLSNQTIRAEDVIRYLNLNQKSQINLKNIIIGTGMHSRLVADILNNENINIDGFISEKEEDIGNNVTSNLKIISSDRTLEKDLKIKDYNFYIGVGGPDNNIDRIKVFKFYQKLKLNMPALVSSQAYVSKNTTIGEGSIILPGANIGPNVIIGNNCIINSNAVVCHDTVLGDHVHITPNAAVAGNCKIGNNSTIGMCSTIYFSIEIGENCLIHNNTSVLQNLDNGKVINQNNQISDNKFIYNEK